MYNPIEGVVVLANNLDLMRNRIVKSEMLNNYEKVDTFTSLQQQRMIIDKRKTLSRAVNYSYQGAWIKKMDDELQYRALINPNKLKQDYDDKIVSVGFEYDFKPGDIFEWVGTDTYWIIYLQDITELAYFRGDIRRCRYDICWKDENGLHHTKAAVRGPVETRIDYIQKHEISIDNPNYSLHIMIPYNDENIKHFERYTKFYLQNDDTCWRIEAIDKYSTPGIITIDAVEYYANDHQDDISKGLIDGLIKPQKDPNPRRNEIIGDTFIKPKTTHTYEYVGDKIATWTYDKKLPLKIAIDGNKITIRWTSSYSGQFDLSCGSVKKTIVVESLF